MNSHNFKSVRVRNSYETNSSLKNLSTQNNYEGSSYSSSSDSSDSGNIEKTGDNYRRKAPSTLFQSTPVHNSSRKQKVGKKNFRNNISDEHGTASFLKRIHISSDESDLSVKQAKKKAKRNSEVDHLPSHLKDLDISVKSEDISVKSEEGRKKTFKRNTEENSLEKNHLKKRRRENNQLIANGDQESLPYVSSSQLFLTQNKSNYSVTSVPSLGAEIVVLQHPTSVVLHKLIDVKVLSGGISVLGTTLTSLSEKVTVFSYERTGLIELATTHAEPMWRTRETFKIIKAALGKIANKEKAKKILEKCTDGSVIVLLQRAKFSSSLRILSVYYPRESWLQTGWKNNCHFIKKNSTNSNHMVVKLTKDHITVAEAIARAMRKATVNNSPGPRVVICGDAHTGKSTVARFIMNKLIDMFSHVLYLDADPGQPEFTPPGVVSLTKVDKCIIGPPFSHLRKPMKMVFTGAISAAASPPMYFKSIKELTNLYFEHSSEALIVNTMGWIKGIGMLCLKNIIDIIQPTIIVELLEDGKESCSEAFANPNTNVDYYVIPAAKAEVTVSSYRGKEQRDFLTLAYFGLCAKSSQLRPMTLNQMQAVCISWDDIPIYAFGSKVMPYRLVECINASVVALCTVDESIILKSDVPQFQTTLKAEPGNICHGFGIVRAIDEEQHLLYIITPLKMEELQKINAIMKGSVTVPDVVFLEQKLVDMPIPFVDQSTAAPTVSREKVRKRRFGGQKVHL